jgi:hypothetical protein
MKFRVTGQNRDSGARMILEFESESKAAAERKALAQGMSVHRVEDITNGPVDKANDPNPRAGRPKRGGNRKLLVVILIVAAALAWVYRAAIMQKLGIYPGEQSRQRINPP